MGVAEAHAESGSDGLSGDRARGPAPRVRLRCSWCHEHLPRDEGAFCAACLAPHHADCHALHGRCAGPGCREEALVRPARSRLITRGQALLVLTLASLVATLGTSALRLAPAAAHAPVVSAPAPPEVVSRLEERPASPRRAVEVRTEDGFVQRVDLARGEALLVRGCPAGREVLAVRAGEEPFTVLIAPAGAALQVGLPGAPPAIHLGSFGEGATTRVELVQLHGRETLLGSTSR